MLNLKNHNSMQTDTIEDKLQLQNRLKEIENLQKVLSEEKEEILLKLQGNFESNKQRYLSLINDIIVSNTKQETEKEGEMIIEYISFKKSALPINHHSEKSEKIEKQTKDQEFLKLTNLDSLRQYFEEDWNIDLSEYSKYTTLKQDANKHEKKARLKTIKFHYLDCHYFFEKQIEKAVLTKEQFNLPPDQLKLAAEPFFEAMITRSKAIDLYKTCEKQSGKLSEASQQGISEIQNCSVRASYLLNSLSYFLDYQTCFDWDYEKLKGVFDLWEGGYSDPEIYCDTIVESYQLWRLLENNKIQLTEDQKTHLVSIIRGVNDLVKNGW